MRKKSRLLPVVIFMLAGWTVKAQEPQRPYGGPGADPAIHAAFEARLHQSDQLSHQAKEVLKKGDIPKAIKLFEQALTMFDLDDETRIRLADIYIQQGKSDDVIRTLKPLIYPGPDTDSSTGREVTTRMKYVLALLDKYQWQEAVSIYETSFTGSQPTPYPTVKNGELKWQLPSGGPSRAVPEEHFSTAYTNYPFLKAQAHFILGCREPMFFEWKDKSPYMIEHLKQALKNNRKLIDARFLIGVLLGKMERFDEARTAFAETARLAPKEQQPEIAAALKDLNAAEDEKKEIEARQATIKARTSQQPSPATNTP